MLCLFHFRKNRKNTWNQQRKKTAVFFARTNLRKSQQSFIQKVLKTSVELLRRTMILSCTKRFEKNNELERLYWYMLIVENDSQIIEKVLIHKLQTVKGEEQSLCGKRYASFVKRLSTKITSHQRNFPES